MNDIDNMTETRNSTEQPISFWFTLKSLLCPCFTVKPNRIINQSNPTQGLETTNQKTSETNHSNNHYRHKQTFEVNQNLSGHRNTRRKNSMQFQQNQKREVLLRRKTKYLDRDFRQTINIQLGYNNRMCTLQEADFPISNLNQNILLAVGAKNKQILTKITRANIRIKLSLFKREIINRKKKQSKMQQKKYGEFQFNKYWDQRYVLFERFDQGIKIDQNSWTVNPPEQISQYIANKCNGAKIILDAFAGVGGNTIKFANINSCCKVIANEQNKKKMGFLLNNAKVYEVDSNIQLNEQPFLQFQRNNIDVVFLQPKLTQYHLAGSKIISTGDFYPTLDKVISKSFQLAPNLILLLPPQINIEILCSCIHKCATQSKIMKDFCSIKIQKIYCQMQIKYILVCIGTLVQTEIKLNQQLEYLYSRLKKPGQVYFKHKKVMKKLREDYGMLQLFNIVKESERRKRQILGRDLNIKQLYTIDFIYDLIREKSLIPADRLSKLIAEQDLQYQRQSSYYHSITFDEGQGMSPVMEEQKIDQNPFNVRQPQLTQSQYSHYTYFESFDKKSGNKSNRSSGLVREKGQKSNPSIIIKRMNTDRSQKSTNSPLTPKVQRQRASQLKTQKQPELKNQQTRDE